MDLPGLQPATGVLRAHYEAEARAGFPNLRHVPSSNVIRLLDYFESLGEPAQSALLDSYSRLWALRFFPLSITHDLMLEFIQTDPAIVACRQASQSPEYSMGLRYEGIRMRKAMMSDPMSMEMMAKTRAGLNFTPRDDMPAELVPDPEPANLKPAKAPLMRKLINQEFKSLLPEKRKLPGGETVYTGTVEDASVTVRIDFGGMGMQLIYSISVAADSVGQALPMVAYEDLWMGGGGRWDYITEENAEASIHLLGEFIPETVRLRRKVCDAIASVP